MKEVDYIIVGLGLAGIAFCEELEKHRKSFVVFDGGRPGASRVSGGIYNPVILKRYTLPWKAEESMELVPTYYAGLSKKLGRKIHKPLPVLRIFSSVEDQNNWFTASAKQGLSHFMEDGILRENRTGVSAPYHVGKVKGTGWVNVPLLLDLYRSYLVEKKLFFSEEFQHDKIDIEDGFVFYKNVRARFIVFTEGYGMKNNPYFNKLPLVGNKGEYIIIKAEKLEDNAAVKSNFFIIPLGQNLYKVGATFNWKEKDTVPTETAREEILATLNKVLTCDFEVMGQEAGIRPTTGDRRPLLGSHPRYPNLVLFNGLGTRGIMMSPYLACILYEHLEQGKELLDKVNIMRFPKKMKI